MKIQPSKIRSAGISVQQNRSKQREEVSFGSAATDIKPTLYAVKNATAFKKLLPILAFFGSVATLVGYSVGSAGLFYDVYKENGDDWSAVLKRKSIRNKKQALADTKIQNKTSVDKFIEKAVNKNDGALNQYFKGDTTAKKVENEGVKTITPTTKFGKIGMKFAKVGIAASSMAGIACGLGEGIPTMALGESTNVIAAPIINTPIGTGLFGIGIASIFSGLALDNTPQLKLNHLKLMAAEGFSDKAKIILKNTKDILKEIGSSVLETVKNSWRPSFWKENIFNITPKTVVFQETINKDGVVEVLKELRHHKNYIMHAASFTLGLGGLGLVVTSLLKLKRTQKAALAAEEGGFLCDNLGMTKLGLDKLTNGAKAAGSSFAIGGIINAISQFMGIDNKDGRAMQWGGIALVFLGFSFDRGKHLSEAIKNSKFRTELRDVVREWKLDLSKVIDKKELKPLLKEIKKNKGISNKKFNSIEQKLRILIGEEFKSAESIKTALKEGIDADIVDKFEIDNIADYAKTKEILKKCTVKTFGSENPEGAKV